MFWQTVEGRKAFVPAQVEDSHNTISNTFNNVEEDGTKWICLTAQGHSRCPIISIVETNTQATILNSAQSKQTITLL